MKIDILTLFPEMFRGPFDESIIKRARDEKLVTINIHQLRDWATDKHKTVDGRPFGGGSGMILKIEPIFSALKDLRGKNSKVVLMSPQGDRFTQQTAKKLVGEHLIIICGRYEGYDERIREHLVDMEISIGDYVLTGGELPAMVITETIARLVPGVLSDEATRSESHSESGVIEYPQYTRPEEFNGWKVPEVLKSGNHAEIEKWRKNKSHGRSKR